MKDKTAIIGQVKKWIKDFVIGLNLCPFAKHPFANNLIRYELLEFERSDDFIDSFFVETQLLLEAESSEISTSLIIISSGLEDFLFYLDVLDGCQDLLEKSGLDKHVQLASFHPLYQFEGTVSNDVTNYTNRSPFPLIHILRTDEVEKAIDSYGNTEEIPENNQKLLKRMGIEKVKKLISVQ